MPQKDAVIKEAIEEGLHNPTTFNFCKRADLNFHKTKKPPHGRLMVIFSLRHLAYDLNHFALTTSHKNCGVDTKLRLANLFGSLTKRGSHSKPIFIQMGCDR